tara:strand:- start:4815 stop:5354 length:540 start_codon:yes stop_codon:yes gene_type:complete
MNFLIISTCTEKLSEREFVSPIANIVSPDKCQILHYKQCNKDIISEFDKILICGTSLQDNNYQKDLKMFRSFLLECEKPILGICSGMQITAMIFGDKITENTEIGMVDVRTLEPNNLCAGEFQAYTLHNYSVNTLESFNVLARSENSIQVFKHITKQIFGVSFHPEVRNHGIIENFLRI